MMERALFLKTTNSFATWFDDFVKRKSNHTMMSGLRSMLRRDLYGARLGAVGLFIPRLRFLALPGLIAAMVGAIVYHLTLDPERLVIPAVVLLVLCIILASLRRPNATAST